CELRNDFRNFRVDRIINLAGLAQHFAVSPGQEMQDYIALMEAEHC
ncbi:MAG: putative DNA-binding transcriptional regulator YafY, partial [Shewanella sp.]